MFRERWHEIAWTTHMRPDLCTVVAKMSHTTKQTFTREIVKHVTKMVRKPNDEMVKGLRLHDLHPETSRMLGYSDSSFANYEDMGTQLGYAILLNNKTHLGNWISYGRYDCRWVARSVLGGETFVFADYFDVAYFLHHETSPIIGKYYQ